MTPPQRPNGEKRLIDWLIALLGIVFAVLLFFLVRQYEILRREAVVNARESWLANAFKNHPHLTASDTNVIRSWMTFDYLNKLFDLPPEYLQTELPVPDSAYPKLTISKFAKDTHQAASSTLQEVQNVIQQYLASPVPANTSST